MKIKSICFLILTSLFLCSISTSDFVCIAHEEDEIYKIVDENYILINYTYGPEVGDMFISENNILYEIYLVDNNRFFAHAKQIEEVKMPNVDENPTSLTPISAHVKQIGMYHTHNDESYVIGDGYDSVYGKGGIMDIGKDFISELKKYNINVLYDETLHLPHNSTAYTRSKSTAEKLLNSQDLDAILDIHRDGVPRSQFIGNVNGKDASKIRMVIGKSNPNYSENLEFAKDIKAYADEHYPGLIKDIYMGKGSYNQNLSKTALLFEMGTYLIEKEYVKNSLPYLADTIDKVMYTDAVESPDKQDSEKSFGETIVENDLGPAINNNNNKEQPSTPTKGVLVAVALTIPFTFGITILLKGKSNKKNKRP